MTDIKYPNLNYETNRKIYGDRFVAGADEVGRGAWAGPVSVGIAVLDLDRLSDAQNLLDSGLNDSKKLSKKKRNELYKAVVEVAADFAVGHATNKICDDYGMSAAIGIAAIEAKSKLKVSPEHYLIDGPTNFTNFVSDEIKTCIVKGDSVSMAIAAASVVAKVTRDAIMDEFHHVYPDYGFSENKGYPSKDHIRALQKFGPCVLHRTSWKFMEKISHYKC